MKNATIINTSVNDRVKRAINAGMEVYANKLMNGFYEPGLEASMQLNLMSIIQNILDQNTFNINERFQVILEKNMPLNGVKDYVDAVIKYSNGIDEYLYLIELKYKKVGDGGPNSGNPISYVDMYKLNQHKQNANVKGCFFVFMTDDKTYTRQTKREGTRMEFPMFDRAKIEKDKAYKAITPAAMAVVNHSGTNNIVFDKDINIEYFKFSVKDKPYWYFIAEC